MLKIKIKLNNFSPEAVEQTADFLLSGKVVVLPTDTVYGLSAAVDKLSAVKKIYRLKKRDQGKPSILLMKSFCQIREYCYLSPRQYQYLKRHWLVEKKVLTVILKGRRKVFREKKIDKSFFLNADDGVAVRWPQSRFLQQVLKLVNQPIISTSLNLSGQKHIADLSDLDRIFATEQPDLIVDAGKLSSTQPSRIEDIRSIKAIKVLRE